MPIYLRQSTASQEIPLGYFVDSTDGNTEETALSIANTDIKIWKTGATTLANKNSGGGTHISNGVYYAVLDATDTDTIGPLVVFVHVAGALAVRVECCVLDEAMYDWQFGTSAPLSPTVAGRTLDVSAGGEAGLDWANIGSPTTTVNLSGTTVGTITALASGSITAAVVATGAIDADALAADAGAEIAAAVWDLDATAHQTQGTFGQAIGDPGATATTVWGMLNSSVGGLESTVNQFFTQYQGGSLIVDINGLVSGSVGSISSGGITSATFAAGAIDAAAIAADAGTEIGTAVWASATRTLTAAGLDSVLIESSISAGASLTDDAGTQLTSINARQAMSLIVSAAAAGVLAGAATTTVTIKPAGKPSGNTRITGTVDSDGNRSAFTLKVPT